MIRTSVVETGVAYYQTERIIERAVRKGRKRRMENVVKRFANDMEELDFIRTRGGGG